MSRRRKNLGDWGEDLACDFLRRHGFEIVERNFFATVGEIDVVARKVGDYYFVEVKTRRDSEQANDSAVGGLKRYRMDKMIRVYCYRRDLADVSLIPAAVIILADAIKRKATIRFVILVN